MTTKRKKAAIARVEWKCPKCGMDHQGCRGKSEAVRSKCKAIGRPGDCSGFICNCTTPGSDEADHGFTYGAPCEEATCYHCDWSGTYPRAPKTKDWEKKALAAGWQPPKGWPNI